MFCRFIATAEHVASGFRNAFPKLHVEVVTGLFTPEDRRARVEALTSTPQRILVATDCLSEGINLQHLFDTVVHYDLSWNPTRHQQREGRVDRFGQFAKLVRSVLLYSPDSSIDGAVLDVVLRKAEAIRRATGVTVPLPEERTAVAGALMNALLLRNGRTEQLRLDLGLDLSADSAEINQRWRDAEEGERRSRARFAQNALRRLRFKLTVHSRQEKLLLVEEAAALAFGPAATAPSSSGDAAFALLESPGSGNLAPIAQERFLKQAHERVHHLLLNEGSIAEHARERAAALLADHERVRAAGVSMGGAPRVSVEPVLPPDVLGIFVLIPGAV